MESNWVMMRIRKATHARLKAMKARLDSQETLPIDLDRSEQDRFGVSLNAIIDWLLLQEEKHRMRGRKKKPSDVDHK